MDPHASQVYARPRFTGTDPNGKTCPAGRWVSSLLVEGRDQPPPDLVVWYYMLQ